MEDINLTYLLSKKERAAVSVYRTRRSMKPGRLIGLMIFCTALSFFPSPSVFTIAMAVCLLGSALYMALLPVIIKRSIPDEIEEVECKVDDAGISFSTSKSSERYDWATFKGVEEISDCLVLNPKKPSTGLKVIPIRSFGEAQARYRALQEIRGRIN